MEQQIALITGTSSGFGKLTAQTLAAKGIKVFAGIRNITTKNASVASELNALNNITVIELDIANETSVETAIKQIESSARKIDILVNNAGVYGLGLVEQFTNNEIQELFNINFFGMLNVTRNVLPLMRKNKSGLVINITSGFGRITMPFNGIYGAAKHAAEAVSQALRFELGMVGVDVVVIEPGVFPSTGATDTSQRYHAADKNIANEYGELAASFPSIFVNAMNQMVSNGYAANPQIIADKIYEIIQTPSDQRPFRIVADPSSNGKLEKMNALNDEIEKDLLTGLQMPFLYK